MNLGHCLPHCVLNSHSLALLQRKGVSEPTGAEWTDRMRLAPCVLEAKLGARMCLPAVSVLHTQGFNNRWLQLLLYPTGQLELQRPGHAASSVHGNNCVYRHLIPIRHPKDFHVELCARARLFRLRSTCQIMCEL